jgi:ABC-type transporter Mla maintaining outer membrane lipid asymmetry permease subunit MlaE
VIATSALRVIGEEVEAHNAVMSVLVRHAAVAGATGAAIAAELGVSRATMYRHYGAVLREGRKL